MKVMNPIFTLLISLFFLFQGCVENKIQQQAKDNKVTEVIKPEKIYLNTDSLLIRIPGKATLKKADQFISDIPEYFEYSGNREIIPGVSYLSQTLEEKLDRKKPVKSKKPKIIRIDFTKLKKQILTNDKPPVLTKLDNEIYINRDSLSYYKKIVIENALFSVQHNDTIYPPLSYSAPSPKRTEALPMKYKEETIFDISILDFDQGLPISFIRGIAKDRQGVLWFVSHNGDLIAYDGNFFDEYNMSLGTAKEVNYALLIDKTGNIWTGTDNGAICFDGKKITRYTKKQGLPSNNIVAIIEDSKNNIWFATTEGVSKFDGETIYTYTKNQGLIGNYIFSLFEDNEGNIWFGSLSNGLTKFDGESFLSFTQNDGLASNNVLSINQDHKGNMWFGTNGGGVSKFDGEIFTNYTTEQGLVSNTILTIIEDANNNMWFGSYGNGISFFKGNSFSTYTTEDGLSDNFFRSVYEDGSGNIWFGADVGITKIKTNGFKHFTKAQGLINNNIPAIFQDNMGSMWIANFENGVSIFNDLKSTQLKMKFAHITTDHGLAHNIITSIIQDSHNNYWIGTYGGGVSKLDGRSFDSGKLKFTNYSLEQGLCSSLVNEVLQDNLGNIWIATDRGVVKFDGERFVTLTKSNLGADKVLCVFQDRSEALWFGTLDGGVSRLFNDTLTRYTIDQGLGNNIVGTITQDHNGIIWFGTDGGGLSYFNGHSFNTLNVSDGLCSNNIFSLITDNNNSLWVGTFRGLCQIKLPDTIKSVNNSILHDQFVLKNYGKIDGLKSVDFYARAAFLDNKNRLWWGTTKALTMLDIKTFISADEVPLIHMDGIEINTQKIDFNELKSNDNFPDSEIRFSGVSKFYNNPINLSLPYNLNHLSFNFSAIDWSAPHQIQYQYKLLGFEQKWSRLTKDHKVDYRNISPGDYTFIVKALGTSGKWSEELEYPFVIRQPWWLSWWAVFVYVLAFILGIWIIIRWRVNIIKRQKLILENMVARRTKDLDKALILAEQATTAKSQFIATMSHEIRTPLNAIMGLTHLAIDNTSDSKQEDYLQKIDRSANTMLSLIDDILDFSKIEIGKMQLENVPFDLEIVLNSVIILNAQHAREKNLEFVVNINSDVPKLLIGDPLRIGQIITNLCNNAVKFTSSGEVVINIGLGKNVDKRTFHLEVEVRDTGIGISEENIPLLFDEFKQADSSITRKYGGTGLGLSISKLLIEMMGGHIRLESKLNIGTTFFFDAIVSIQNQKSLLINVIPDELKDIELLVCDDNSSALKALKETLESFSLNLEVVSSGEEVLNRLRHKSYDLLLIDHYMKGKSGVDTIIEIIGTPNFLPIKTILITDSDRSIRSLEQYIIGINGYLIKPTMPSVVLEKIIEVFGLEKSSSHFLHKKKTQLAGIKKAISGRRILLVEDNEINRQVVFELVEKVGVLVDVVEDGASAVKKAKEIPYDLILMDLHMPVMDGMEATKKIREYNTQIPIIAITADTMNDIKIKCKQVGINDVITKPIDPGLLYEVLINWISPNERTIGLASSNTVEFDTVLSKISIPGLNIKLGVRRFGDNEELYLKMLKKFISSNGQTCGELRELIKQKEFDKAHLKIHTLKGESANIGVNNVYELSMQIEQFIINRDIESFEKEITVLERKLEEFSSELQFYFCETSGNQKNDILSFQDLVKNLTECLKIRDPKAFDLLDKLNEKEIKKSELDAINKAVNSGNSDEALALLKKLLDDNISVLH